MSLAPSSMHSEVAPHEVQSQPARKRIDGTGLSIFLIIVLGIGMLLYTQAADWFSTRNHNAEVSGYFDAVDGLDDAERKRALELAAEYNARMPQGPLRDPYTHATNPDEESEAYNIYRELLAVSGSGVIGQVTYPRLDIALPVYHGTDDKVLRKGAGHIYGSSLPVGGPSTHSVLTSHSGLVNASLFTPLVRAEVGDVFTVQVLGETHWYQVDQVSTVLPHETSALNIVDNKDYVTLVTCTPVGVNTHRYLVHGVRITPPDTPEVDALIAGDGVTEGFPWWALVFVVGAAGVGYILFRPARGQRRSRELRTL